jgi:hypothetical protein
VEVASFQTDDGKLPFDKIQFGPSLPLEPTEKAIRLLLFARAYDEVEIKIEGSGIPLRW